MSYHVRLVKGLSYCGAVKATKKHPDVFVEDKATADDAVATGYFKHVEDTEETSTQQPEPESGKTLDEMTVPELETYAAYHNVSLKGLSKKADIIEKLKAELGAEVTKNAAEYGSPTVVELQKEP